MIRHGSLAEAGLPDSFGVVPLSLALILLLAHSQRGSANRTFIHRTRSEHGVCCSVA
jgi:hypothetical protein